MVLVRIGTPAADDQCHRPHHPDGHGDRHHRHVGPVPGHDRLLPASPECPPADSLLHRRALPDHPRQHDRPDRHRHPVPGLPVAETEQRRTAAQCGRMRLTSYEKVFHPIPDPAFYSAAGSAGLCLSGQSPYHEIPPG